MRLELVRNPWSWAFMLSYVIIFVLLAIDLHVVGEDFLVFNVVTLLCMALIPLMVASTMTDPSQFLMLFYTVNLANHKYCK